MADKTTNNQATTTARQFTGVVVSDAADKTITVEVKTRKMHPKYKKQYWVSKKYAVHDEKNAAHVGDSVLFEETRPMSKRKRWKLVQVEKTA